MIIKKGASEKEILKMQEKLSKKKSSGFKANKYKGKIKFNKDALLIQNKLRDEWERNIG